jgi:hypothetical protein
MTDQAMAMDGAIPRAVPALGERALFRPGDELRIATRSPIGHYRVPVYLRGKVGRVEAVIEPARRQIEVLDSRTPALGAAVVARAWVDPPFRERLLANGRATCKELGISFYDDTQLIVLENTETVHNLVVCTLCSCYPRPVLGLPPDW